MKKIINILIKKYFLKPDPRFRVGDLCYKGDSNYEYEFAGIYYDAELKPFGFMRDPADGRIYAAPLNECRTPYTR